MASSESDVDGMPDIPLNLHFGKIGGEENNTSSTRNPGLSYRTRNRKISNLKTIASDLVKNFPGQVDIILIINSNTEKSKKSRFFGKAYGQKAEPFLKETSLGKEIVTKLRVTAATWAPAQEDEEQEKDGMEAVMPGEAAGPGHDAAGPVDAAALGDTAVEELMAQDDDELPNVSTEATDFVIKCLAKSRAKAANQKQKLIDLEKRRQQQKVTEAQQRKRKTATGSVRKATNETTNVTADSVPEDVSNASATPIRTYGPKRQKQIGISSTPTPINADGEPSGSVTIQGETVSSAPSAPVASRPIQVCSLQMVSPSVKSSRRVVVRVPPVGSGEASNSKSEPVSVTPAPAAVSTSIQGSIVQCWNSASTPDANGEPPGSVEDTSTQSQSVAASLAQVVTSAQSSSVQMCSHKVKCCQFFSTLLRKTFEQKESVFPKLQSLVQDLVDAKLEVGDFSTSLQKELNSSLQTHVIQFIQNTLPTLRESLATKELTIEWIRPPGPPLLSSVDTPSKARVQSALYNPREDNPLTQ